MKKIVGFWFGLGTKLQLAVAASLAVILAVAIITPILAGRIYEPYEEYAPIVLVPQTPAPTPEPVDWPEIYVPVIEEEEEEYEEEKICQIPRSLLTGLYLDEAYIERRPVAVVINNTPDARPQSGVANADIIYEVLVEGSITRLLLVFQSDIPEKIGPVRSVRDYFVDFALNHDAFFVHHGGSPTGYQRIRNLLGINAVDGIRFEGTIFWRDRSYPEWTGIERLRAMEHSSFTSWQRLARHIESFGIRDYVTEGFDVGFYFGELPNNASVHLRDIASIIIPFARNTYTTFIYDKETGKYLVEHIRGMWQDAVTEEQVAVANVLVQKTSIRVKDNVGRRHVETLGSGPGYLMRGGVVYNVTWEKYDHSSPMRWFFLDGTPAQLAPGRTWINVLQNTTEPIFEAAPVFIETVPAHDEESGETV